MSVRLSVCLSVCDVGGLWSHCRLAIGVADGTVRSVSSNVSVFSNLMSLHIITFLCLCAFQSLKLLCSTTSLTTELTKRRHKSWLRKLLGATAAGLTDWTDGGSTLELTSEATDSQHGRTTETTDSSTLWLKECVRQNLHWDARGSVTFNRSGNHKQRRQSKWGWFLNTLHS